MSPDRPSTTLLCAENIRGFHFDTCLFVIGQLVQDPGISLWSYNTEPPQIWWSPKCQFSVFCMIHSEKGLVFGDFWCVTSKKFKKSSFFFLASVIMLSRSPNRIHSDGERYITNRTSILVHLCHQLHQEYTCFKMQLI